MRELNECSLESANQGLRATLTTRTYVVLNSIRVCSLGLRYGNWQCFSGPTSLYYLSRDKIADSQTESGIVGLQTLKLTFILSWGAQQQLNQSTSPRLHTRLHYNIHCTGRKLIMQISNVMLRTSWIGRQLEQRMRAPSLRQGSFLLDSGVLTRCSQPR